MGLVDAKPLEILQVSYLLISQLIFQTLSWSFSSNMIVFVLCSTFALVFLVSAIICKLIRMRNEDNFHHFKKSQLSFVIPYALMVGEIYLYAWGFRTALYYQSGSNQNQYWVYVYLLFMYFAYSLVCTAGLCTRLEYICYIISMVYQLCLLTYETAQLIGLSPPSNSTEYMYDILLQQSKDIKICFLSLFIASILIMMDYLNKTQEQAERKQVKRAKSAKNPRQLQILA